MNVKIDYMVYSTPDQNSKHYKQYRFLEASHESEMFSLIAENRGCLQART